MVVRHLDVCAHFRTPEEAAAYTVCIAAKGIAAPPEQGGAEGAECPAQRVQGQAAEAVAVLQGDTLAKGLAALREKGTRLPSDLVRDLRVLDGASTLLRHPRAAKRTVARLRAALRGGTSQASGDGGGSKAASATSAASDNGSDGDSSVQATDTYKTQWAKHLSGRSGWHGLHTRTSTKV